MPLEKPKDNSDPSPIDRIAPLIGMGNFTTPQDSMDFLDNLTPDDFKAWLDRLNQSIRVTNKPVDVPSGSYIAASGMNGVAYEPPQRHDREHLLRAAFIKAQQLSSHEAAGLTLSLAINAVHYYSDGNGRLSRLIYRFLNYGYRGSQDDECYNRLLSNTAGRSVHNLSQEYIGSIIQAEMFDEIVVARSYDETLGDNIPSRISGVYDSNGKVSSNLVRDPSIDTDHLMMLLTLITNKNDTVVMMSLMKTFQPERLSEHIIQHPQAAFSRIDGASFLPTLTTQDIETWLKNFYLFTREYVRRIIDVSDRDDYAEIAECYRTNSWPQDMDFWN